MAISKYSFVNTSSGAANVSELYDYLSANATSYFDSITKDDSGNVTCSVSDGGSIYFASTGGSVTITLAGGSTASVHGSYATTQIYSTSKGLVLYNNNQPNSGNINIAITKSNEGTTFVLYRTSSGATGFGFADLVKSSATVSSINYYTNAMPLTTLTPFVASGGVYTPNLFFTYFSEYPMIKSVINMGGTDYVYSGLVALAD